MEGLRAASTDTETERPNAGKNLYKTIRLSMHRNECNNKEIPSWSEKAPNWEKICFQLEKFFFPVRNPVLGGYKHFIAFPSIFFFFLHPKNGERYSKKILHNFAFSMT